MDYCTRQAASLLRKGFSSMKHENHKKRCLDLEFGHSENRLECGGNIFTSNADVELWHCDDCGIDYIVDWHLKNGWPQERLVRERQNREAA